MFSMKLFNHGCNTYSKDELNHRLDNRLTLTITTILAFCSFFLTLTTFYVSNNTTSLNNILTETNHQQDTVLREYEISHKGRAYSKKSYKHLTSKLNKSNKKMSGIYKDLNMVQTSYSKIPQNIISFCSLLVFVLLVWIAYSCIRREFLLRALRSKDKENI